MGRPLRYALFSFGLLGLGAIPGSCGGAPRPQIAPRTSLGLASTPAPLLEDENGVVGGPIDQTQFVFDTEPTDGPAQLVLDGVGTTPEWVRHSLAPYLEARRARVAGIGAEGDSLLVITRIGETAQAASVQTPLAEPIQLTFSKEPVIQASYVPGSSDELVYRSDYGGNEDYQILRLDSATQTRLITDGQSRHGPFAWSVKGEALAYAANARDASDMDIYLSDGKSASGSKVVSEREGSWVVLAWSRREQKVLLRHYLSLQESSIYVLDVPTGEVYALVSPLPGVTHEQARLIPNEKRAYVTANRDRDFITLYEVDTDTEEIKALTSSIPWDVQNIALSRDAAQLAFDTNEDGWSVLRLLDTRTGKFQVLNELPRGVITGLRFASQKDVLAFTLESPGRPPDAYTYDLGTSRLTRWTRSEPVERESAHDMTPRLVRYPSFDGLSVPAWVYRPKGEGPFPVLIWVHGGPEQQTRPTYNPVIEYFVSELGVAVVAPNVRGSDGYGRAYLALDDGMKREDAIRDIGALLDWIQTHQDLDSARVGIHGTSYGGYVVLASLVHFGSRIAAGCDVVGISNFVTFLENTRSYRVDQRRAEYGDEQDAEMRAFLESASPLRRAAEIESALFVVHGANDPRVPVGEAEQIVRAVREAGQDAWYMLALDEGHGFRKRANRDAFYESMVAFFARYLRLRDDNEISDDGPVEEPDEAGDLGT